MKNAIAWILFLVLLVFIGSSDAAQRRSLADCAGDWNNPGSDDVCYDLTKEQWYQYDGSNWLPTPLQSTVASLPVTCDQGQRALLTDGDAAGNEVICDGSNVWRSPLEISHGIINPAFPPYNCLKAASNNGTCLQAVADAAVAFVTASPTIRGGIWFPAGYITTSAIVFDFGSATSALLHMSSLGRQGGIQCNFSGSATSCLRFTTTGSTLNTIVLRDMFVTSGPSRPDRLIYFEEAAQVRMDNVLIGDFERHGIAADSLQNSSFTNSICATGATAPTGANPACIAQYSSWVNVVISGWQMETGASTSGTNFFAGGATTTRTITIANNVCATGSDVYQFALFNYNAASDISVVNNRCDDITDSGVYLTGSGTATTRLNISNNSFTHNTSGGTACIFAENVSGGQIVDNDCTSFADGVDLTSVTGTRVAGNRLKGGADGVVTFTAFTDMLVENNICDSITTRCMAIGGTSGGGNIIRGTTIQGTAPTTPYVTTTLDAATDVLEFGDGVQAVTCAVSGDANPGALTITPYYNKVQITNSDTDGCDITMGEQLGNGQHTMLTLISNAGGNVAFADSAGVLEMAGGVTFNMATVPDTLSLSYLSGATDTWYEVSRADN